MILRSIAVAAIVSGLLRVGLGQQRISLDGEWRIRAESSSTGAFQPILVPGPFEQVLGTEFDGIARYRLRLPLPAHRCRRVAVEFAAVATHAQVFVNGHRVAEHLGGWTPFRAELTRHLRWNGQDQLEVVVDERVGHNTQGFLPVIQPHFGGIWQSVTLCCDDTPTLDRDQLFLFGNGNGELTVRPAVHQMRGQRAQVLVEVLDGERVVASRRDSFDEPLIVPDARRWRPGAPALYTARISLFVANELVDRVERRFGFRELRADGTCIRWNGVPLSVRGILHWGYSPPSLAPPSDAAHWRRQLEYFQSLGFNTVKCCLWVPPSSFYELCDELGMLVWQEYPTWHPQMDQAHKRELLREYDEFFRHDRNHPSVAFRSITCETGHGADLDVVRTLFDACKAAVPDTLVVDDSSWIGWQRITDFWDEHPYGNNSWFPQRLAHFAHHIEQHGAKPLLLGECFAADTWVDRDAWLAEHGEQPLWWRPACWNAQRDAERWLSERFDSALLQQLEPVARRFANENRRFQIEQLRLGLPDAGYVVSVARDFTKARMGFYDDLDRPKFAPAAWSWHRDTMLCLDLPWHTRTLRGQHARIPVVVSHRGDQPLRGELLLSCAELGAETRKAVQLAPGANSPPEALVLELDLPPRLERPRRVRVRAQLRGSHAAESAWDFWVLPASEGRDPAQSDDPRPDVLVADHLTAELLDQLEAGARVLLRLGTGPGSVRSEALWFLRGAPFAPDHPFHRRVPKELLLDQVAFELESGQVIPWAPWRDQIDPILGFWDTHDLDDVRFWLHAFETRVGAGRLVVSALRHAEHGLPAFVEQHLRAHLRSGPAPRRGLHARTLLALRQKLRERTIELVTWRFRTDPDDVGKERGWFAPDADVSGPDWRDLTAGSHWENQAEDLRHYTGVAWYRIDVDVPADWRGVAARAVFDGVDDSFDVWLNGEWLGSFGDEHQKVSIWLEQQVQELGQRLRPGQPNTLVLRVVDHAGAGGLWKGVRLTTGPIGTAATLLR